MPWTIQGRLAGVDAAVARLRGLPPALAKRILRPAMRKAAAPVLRRMREKAPVGRNKLLRKALGMKVIATRAGGVVVILGPRTGFRAQVGVRRDGTPVYEDPARTAHLVELGHGGPAPAPPHPFARPAFDEGRAEASQVAVAEIAAGIERAAVW